MEKKKKSKSLKQIVSKKRKTKKTENNFQLENKVEVNDVVKPIKTLVTRKSSIDMTGTFVY